MSKISKGIKIAEILRFFLGKPLQLDLDIKLLFSGIEIGTLKIKGAIKIGEESQE